MRFFRFPTAMVRPLSSLAKFSFVISNIPLAMFDEIESHAVWLLGEQEMTQQDAAKVILHGKGSGDAVASRRRHKRFSSHARGRRGRGSVASGVVSCARVSAIAAQSQSW